ncbi:MAG TPA: DUF1385 domain-containing protein [Chthonomonadales bacterium]|nr:DUF1385 domain-containing protein [Chthonomonadales bacterium]
MRTEKDRAEPAPSLGASYLQYGGQAVIEGVMMRSPRYFAVSCRKPDGEIVTRCEEVDKGLLRKLKFLNRPFLRGSLALIDAMALGARALKFASSVQMEAQLAQNYGKQARVSERAASNGNGIGSRLEAAIEADSASLVNGPPILVSEGAPEIGRINDVAIGGTIVLSFVFGIGLFVLAPTLLTGALQKLGYASHITYHKTFWLNLTDGAIRMAIFFGYIALISLMPQIREVFKFHGAEHKAINTLEAGRPLNRQTALEASRIHPRCGTSFIFIVLVINLIVFAFLPRPVWYLRVPLHLSVIPLVAGLAYEVIKLAGKYRRYPLVMAVFAPGMWSQYLTTREPEVEQVDVALAALNAVLEAEAALARQENLVSLPANAAETQTVTA